MIQKIEHIGIAVKDAEASEKVFNALFNQKPYKKEMYVENSRDTFVLFALGMEYLGLNNLDQAELFFNKCLEVDEGYVPALYQMAILLNNRGLEDESLRLLDRGLLLLKVGNDQKTLNEFRSLREEISF